MSPTTVANTSQLLKALAANATEIIMEPGPYSTMNSSGHPNTVTISKRLFLAAGVSLAALATNADAFIRGGPYGAPSGASINFGAKTLAGHGGSPCGYIGTNALSITSGNTGSVWVIDSHNKLVPAGTYGTANTLGAGPYTLTLTDGAVTFLITVNVVPNVWTITPIPSGTNADTSTSCQLLTVANSASLAFGDTISLRDGDYNPSRFAWTVKRAGPPTGSWPGVWSDATFIAGVYTTAVWTNPNWVVITPEAGAAVILETIGFNGVTTANQYFSLRNIPFSLASGVNGVTLTNGASILEITGNDFTSSPAAGLTSATQASIAVNGNGVTNYVSIIDNTFTNCRQAVNLAGSHIQVWGNTATTLYENFAQVSWAQGSPVNGLDVSFNTAIGLVQIAPTHDDFIILFSSATSGVSRNFMIVGNVFASGPQVGANSTGQGIFNKFGTQPSTASITGMVVAGNFILTAGNGMPLDQLDSTALIEGNTIVTDSTYTGSIPSLLRLTSSTAPAVKYNASTGGVAEPTPISPAVQTGNITIPATTLTQYQIDFANPVLGAGNVSLAQILTDWANKAGGPLDTPSPKVGAIGTGYVDYVGRTTAFPY